MLNIAKGNVEVECALPVCLKIVTFAETLNKAVLARMQKVGVSEKL